MAAEIEVQYFAAARDLCGVERERVALPSSPTSAREVLELLGRRHVRLGALAARMRLAVNGEIVAADHVIAGGDEIAVLPPVAGGSEPAPRDVLCAVRAQPLSVDEAIAAVSAADAGGIALFIGTVRDHADGAAVARLDYEAHPTLAEREMRRVLDEVAAAHAGVRLAALHRVGSLAIGDLAVIVAASAAHRAEAFAACRAAIEQIKERVPIWKKEWAPDGSASWVKLKG